MAIPGDPDLGISAGVPAPAARARTRQAARWRVNPRGARFRGGSGRAPVLARASDWRTELARIGRLDPWPL